MNNNEYFYTVKSKYDFWSFLNGYSCKAQSKDHFIRHLGHRFSKKCSMYELNNAYASNEIIIKTTKENAKKQNNQHVQKIDIVDEYFSDYGYVVELNKGTKSDPIIEQMIFVNDAEASEWLNSQK